MVIEPSRISRLEEARLRAIVRDSFGVDPAELQFGSLPFGVVARAGERGWIASSAPDPGVLGGVLMWAERNDVERIDLIVEHHGGLHARRARLLAPQCAVWQLVGSTVVPAVAEPLAAPARRLVGLGEIEKMIVATGATVVHEGGILRAEVSGLEVGRVVTGPDGSVFESGVGRFDREAGVLLNTGRDPAVALSSVVEQVVGHRQVGAPPHSVGRLARGRWLRSLVLQSPELAGVVHPEPVDPIPSRASLLEEAPSALIGRDGGRMVLVMCCAGVDLGLVPQLADLIDRHAPDEGRVLMPSRDRHPALERLARRLPVPIVFRDIVPPWSVGS